MTPSCQRSDASALSTSLSEAEDFDSVPSDRRCRRAAILYFEAGGGHKAAALALQAMLESGSSWQVELLNLQEHLDVLDPTRRLVGVRVQDMYNRMLSRGSTRLMHRLLPVLHAAVRIYTPLIAKRLANYWRKTRPDIVVSVVPNLNRAIAFSVASAIPTVPFVTVLTDFADTPPHFWVEKESQYLVCGTERAAEQALSMGHSFDRVFRASGMIMHPRFYKLNATEDPASLRRKLGLDPTLTTLLVMFGGQGSRDMLEVAKNLNGCSTRFQVIYVCGRNEALRRDLEAVPSSIPRFITGFTSEMERYMQASDVMIGKPGPGSISEALHFGLPVIVTRNGSTMPQEVYNTYWVEENGVGVVLRDFREISESLDELLQEDRLEALRGAVRRQVNNAIFEIPNILQQALSQSTNASSTNRLA